MKTRLLLLGLLVAAAALTGASAGAGGALPSPTAATGHTATPSGAVVTGSAPSYCNPCLYYSGDFDPNSSSAASLANENDIIVPGSKVFTPVKPDGEWLVTGLFVNTVSNLGFVDPSTTPWEIRTGMGAGNGGSVYASGTGTTSYAATGRSAWGYTEYTVLVTLSSSVQLHQGVTYYVNVQPQCTNAGSGSCGAARYYETTVPPATAANHVGPENILDGSLWWSPFFGKDYQPASDSGYQYALFSFGVLGAPPTGTITVTKRLVSNSFDPARFNLRVDGTTSAWNVGNGGTTGQVTVLPGDHTVSEAAGINASLGNYTAKIVCSDGSAGYGTSLSGVHVDAGGHVDCTITNTRKLFKT